MADMINYCQKFNGKHMCKTGGMTICSFGSPARDKFKRYKINPGCADYSIRTGECFNSKAIDDADKQLSEGSAQNAAS